MRAWKGTVILTLIVALCAIAPTVRTADAQTKVTFSLDFIPLGRHAPWYAALAQGYFKDEGLEVSIIPGQGSAQVIQAVESGTADLGFVDVPSLVLARASGSRIKMLAVNYQKAPYAIFTLSTGADVIEPKQLEGLTLGSGAGSFTPKIIKGFMTQKSLDPNKLSIANIAPPARASALLTGKVPAIEFFVMAKPGLEQGAKDKNAELRTLLLADHGLQLYSNGIAGTEDYISNNPDVVKRFVRAALKGWKFALANPDKAASDQLKYIPSLKPDVITAELEVLRNLSVTPDVLDNGLGTFDPQQMQASLEFVKKNIGVSDPAPKASDLYLTGFLPEPPIKP